MGRKDSFPAVSYINLKQLWFPKEQRKEADMGTPGQSPPHPQQKTLKAESEPSLPARPKSLTQKPAVPAPTKPLPEPRPVFSKLIIPTDNPNVAPVETAGSPTQERHPQPLSPISESSRSAGQSLIKKGNDSVAVSTIHTMGPALIEATPIVAENSTPIYPRIARRHGWKGEVLLLVQVNKAGQILKVQIDQPSGHPILDQAALKAVRGWHFHPARFNHQPVKAKVMVPIRFELQEP